VLELGTKYHLDVSLFERLINNGVHCAALNTQHRMRPEVASLICPTIYPHLVNHPSVYTFPPVRGVSKNVFFLDHTSKDEQVRWISRVFTGQGNQGKVRGKKIGQRNQKKSGNLKIWSGKKFYFT
jgi:superfamily I DNA and/or RNA helicase